MYHGPYLQDCSLKRSELGAVRTQTEREAREKRRLEDAVMEKMMQQLTMDKSTQYTRKSVERLQVQKEKLVCVVKLCKSVNLQHWCAGDSSSRGGK